MQLLITDYASLAGGDRPLLPNSNFLFLIRSDKNNFTSDNTEYTATIKFVYNTLMN